MLLELSNLLFNRLGIIVLFAFLLTKSKLFKKYIIMEKLEITHQMIVTLIFGAAGVLATYWGIPFSGAIVNSRSIAIVIAGMIGGPIVGIGAGIIAGVHRMLINAGPLTAVACGLSTIVGGIIGGLSKKYIQDKREKWLYGFIIGLFVESVQMGMILLIAKPYVEALHIVKVIFIPMMFINSVGISIFLALLQQIYDDREKAGAIQAQLALSIATKTLPYFRKGLYEESAANAAKIIFDMTDIQAVSITDQHKILAHVGAGDNHHKTGVPISTNITKRAITEKRFMIAYDLEDIECNTKNCPLKSAIIVPLFENSKVIGTLKLYKVKANDIRITDIELAKGIAHLFSTQIELSKIEYQKYLIRKAEFKRLQAQIRPHFLFNTLNTIVSFCRTDPSKARDLLLELSFFLRSSIKHISDYITLEEELKITNSYLSIIQARFSDKIFTHYTIEADMNFQVPPFIIEPLVENAVIHGVLPKEDGGNINIKIFDKEHYIHFIIQDDGIGMNKDKIETILEGNYIEGGIGVRNVNERLNSIYHQSLSIKSHPGEGTEVSFKVPKEGVIYD